MKSAKNGESRQENLIAYCGLYCNDCHGHNGRIPDLARDLREELRSARYEKFAAFISTYPFGKDFEKYDECYTVLGAMVRFRCKKGCRAGGGSPFCKIRTCVLGRGLAGCWECDAFETCEELQFLKPVHGNAHLKNLKILRKRGEEAFLTGTTHWYTKPKQPRQKGE
jgi:hypothetical protein